MRRAVLGLACTLVACACAGVVVARHDPGPRRTAAAERTHDRRLDALRRGQIRFALTLRLHERRLDAYLRRVAPGRLSAAQFGRRFGESDARLRQLRTALRRLGITVTRVYPQRTAMLARARVDRLDDVFGLRFGRYVTAAGQPYHAAEGAPRIPLSLARYVVGLGDLSSRAVTPDDVPAGGLTPQVTASAYDIDPLWQRGVRGQGETIAVASAFGAINSADLEAYARHTGGAEPHVEFRRIDGGSRYSPARGSDAEVDMDLQIIGGIAPRARIIDYQGSQGSSLGHSLADIYNQIEQDGQATVVSTSYGECEAALDLTHPGDQALIDNALKALEASGVTVFVASGDSGAYACLQLAQIQPASAVPTVLTRLGVQTPASSPYAVSVGGTRLEVRADGGYLAESAWATPLQRDGGGGGLSASEARPSWQQGPGVATAAPNPDGRRQVPDVAGPAAPSSGFAICQTEGGGSGAPDCSPGYGGTSAAAPFWAASMLLVGQYARAHGAGRLARCFAAPVLYRLAARHQPVAPFHQIVYGNNGYYPARPGWNYATGLGSPDVFNLAQDYAAYLRGRGGSTCPF